MGDAASDEWPALGAPMTRATEAAILGVWRERVLEAHERALEALIEREFEKIEVT